MSRQVVIGLKLDVEFIRLLKLNVGMHGNNEPDVSAVLAKVVLMEARGAFPEQVHAAIPINWRDLIEVVESAREVIES